MKPRILIVSPVTPYPVHHGAGSCIYGYIRALRDAFDIDFVGFCPDQFRSQAQAGLKQLCRKVLLFRAPPARRLDCFADTPFLFSNLQSDEMHRAVDRLLREESPDLVQVEYLGLASYAESARCPRIARAHVLEWWHYYLNWRQVRPWRARIENLFWSLDAVRQNRRTLQEFDWVLVTSDEERRRALELAPGARVEALPFMLMDCSRYHPPALAPRTKRLLFVGFLPHTPNTDALSYFIRQEWPLVRCEVPDARLSVVGEGASNALRGLMHDHDVDYLGYVEDLRELYSRTRVYIAPVTSGGGIRTKIVEAMTAGIPVVCNSFAPLGLGVLPNHHVVVRDRPEDSAAAIVDLLRDDCLWMKFRNAGRALAENCFSLERVGPQVVARYLQFLEQHAGVAA